VGLCSCVYYWNIEYSEGTNECSAYVLNNNITSAVHNTNLLLSLSMQYAVLTVLQRDVVCL
jgi:hypothetical protein